MVDSRFVKQGNPRWVVPAVLTGDQRLGCQMRRWAVWGDSLGPPGIHSQSLVPCTVCRCGGSRVQTGQGTQRLRALLAQLLPWAAARVGTAGLGLRIAERLRSEPREARLSWRSADLFRGRMCSSKAWRTRRCPHTSSKLLTFLCGMGTWWEGRSFSFLLCSLVFSFLPLCIWLR